MKIRIILIVVLQTLTTSVIGANCESTQTGLWSQSTTWTACANGIPQDDDSVLIKAGHTVTLNQSTPKLEGMSAEAGGVLNVAASILGSTINSNTNASGANFDFQYASIALLGDLTINAQAHNILLGTVNGPFGLILNSSAETRFKAAIGGTTALASVLTDAAGSTVFADIITVGVNTPNFTVNGSRIFNDPVLLANNLTINGVGGAIIFNSTIDSESNKKQLSIANVNGDSITFSDNIGGINELHLLNIFNSPGTVVNLNLSSIKTFSNQGYKVDVLLNSPSNTITMESSNNSSIILGKNNNLNYLRSESTSPDALIVTTGGIVELRSRIGENSQQLKDLTINLSSSIELETSSIIVADTITFNAPVIMTATSVLEAAIIDIQSSIDNAGFDLTVDTTDTTQQSQITGVISGAGDLIKNGAGDFSFYSINTMTGDILLNQGQLMNQISSDAIFPDVPVLSLEAGSIAFLGDNPTNNYIIGNNQSIIGDGIFAGNLITQSGAIVSPGFGPGRLLVDEINMDTGSILSIEINGNVVTTEYDQLQLDQGGSLDVDLSGGATLDISIGFNPIIGDTFKIISSNSILTGNFSGLSEGVKFVVDDQVFSISYVGGTGNDVVLTALGSSIIHVDQNAIPSGDGQSWDTAFDNLQDALADAISGMEIWVAQGVYYPDIGGPSPMADNVNSTFNIINGVKVYGGFDGSESDLNSRNPELNITVLSGDIDGDDTVDANGITASYDDLSGSNAYHVITTSASDSSTLIDGLVVTAGWAAGPASNEDRGAALFCSNSQITLNNVNVQGNRSNNRAVLWGCVSEVTQSSFINNYANRVGAISTSSGSYIDTLFMGNRAGIQGSVFYVSEATITLIRSKFIANHGNSIIRAQDGTLNLDSVLFRGNSSSLSRGVFDLSLTVNGTFNNITMTGNDIAIRSASSGVLTINNSLFWNNINGSSIGLLEASINHTGTGVITVNSSIVEGSNTSGLWNTGILVDGGNNLDQDPLFLLATDPTTAPTSVGNAHLNIGSPAINTGDNSVVTSVTDLDGNVRIQDTTVDMGAYEFSSHNVSVTVTGLDAGSLVLQNNGTDDLTFNNDGIQVFSTAVANTADYLVTVLSQPTTPNQECVITNGSGTIAGVDISVGVVCTTLQYNVVVDVAGLANGVTLSLLSTVGLLDVTANGLTNFPTAINDGDAYIVSILNQPSSPNQECVITSNNDMGNISGADETIVIVCTTLQYTIGVDVSGLAIGNSVSFENVSEGLTVIVDGNFDFPTALDDGSVYDVAVIFQPTMPNQMCSVVPSLGILQGVDVLLTVTCTTNQYFVGGMASGLAAGNSVSLSLGAEDLSIISNAAFVFLNPLVDESNYSVSITTQPTIPNQTCSLVNPAGTIAGNDVTDMQVNCTTNQYMIGGTVTGLHSGNNLVIQNNGGDDLMITNDGNFDFVTAIEDLLSYTVSILNQPSNPIQPCVISNNTGNVSGSPITTVSIVCEFGDDLIFRDGFETP